MIFQLSLLWFLQTQSCQHVWTGLLYLPTNPLFFYPAVKVFQAPENPALQSTEQGLAGHFFLSCATLVLHYFWHFPFLLAIYLPLHLL